MVDGIRHADGLAQGPSVSIEIHVLIVNNAIEGHDQPATFANSRNSSKASSSLFRSTILC